MMNKKVIRLNPELESVLDKIKQGMNFPQGKVSHGPNQMAQVKLAEFARIGMEFAPKLNKKQNKGGKKQDPTIVRVFDALTPFR